MFSRLLTISAAVPVPLFASPDTTYQSEQGWRLRREKRPPVRATIRSRTGGKISI